MKGLDDFSEIDPEEVFGIDGDALPNEMGDEFFVLRVINILVVAVGVKGEYEMV